MNKCIPMIINGMIQDFDNYAYKEVKLNNDNRVKLSVITESSVSKTLNIKDRINLNLNQIVNFLYTVGQRWKSEEYNRRRTYIRELKTYLGYSDEMARLEANWIAMLLCSKSALYDIVNYDLGSIHVLDEWLPRGDCYVKAQPKGVSVHLLAGNVPLSGVTSILRAILTKNECIIKTSSSDPFTANALVSSFIDVNADHPITKSMSVMYWPHDEDMTLPQRIMNHADVVIAWGGDEAIKWAVKYSPPHVDILKFGPKKSLSIIEAPKDIEAAAMGVAHDICFYDQQACFSTQDVYYIGDNLPLFLSELEKQLDRYAKILPKGSNNFDEKAAFTLTEKESLFAGYEVRKGDKQAWLIVVSPTNSFGNQPLSRSVYVHQVSDINDVIPFVNKNRTQTVSIYPWEASLKYRDKLARSGVERIVESGMNNIFRVGGAHDSLSPLQYLVRFISHERPFNYTTKDVAVEIEQTRYLEEDKFLVFVP
ncbi:aldehyde dehydrogenase family protein [Aliivibrio fischeri]|uniref:Acyl-CoA reductase n=1 Tax=Aliivibrio fischeri (strain MJ11) TaxID=388396 RepID=B5EV71_ALIFM|nr:aldehyde dehydrogenase family protein [Aliivibrio fischeri]ACH63403.1 acyl-CoA reductase [Aliivibrio fischeri MJ11]MUJ22271.1 aldehyde dehydrogenase family protein [Aliivibrio fischeri]MUK36151.1 aldehyde dehydrogenase family protein [Aliivibrio fischeri]MUL00626.1 aldehyde dehydrogenase family protein [Aliivibrio fischeri]MUL07522.1 aldehyde dehydrogenase family protein [Aliivibrio fischeri]